MSTVATTLADNRQYRRLVDRLPELARERLRLAVVRLPRAASASSGWRWGYIVISSYRAALVQQGVPVTHGLDQGEVESAGDDAFDVGPDHRAEVS